MQEQQEFDDKRFALDLTVLLSMNHEKMVYKLCYRIDKLCSFLILLGAMAVVDKNLSALFLGSCLAVCSVFQIVYSPSVKYFSAKYQHAKYLRLYHEMDSLSFDELEDRFCAIQETDSDSIGVFYHPARLEALAMMGYDNRTEWVNERKMRWFEKFALWFIGEHPEFQFK